MWTFVGMIVLAWVLVASAEPVDTRQFGFIKVGMSEREVLQRLGKPDDTVVTGRSFVPVAGPGRRELVEVKKYAHVWFGNGQIMDTVIRFENGVVVQADKVRSSGVRR
jgi:hypothetical protein